MSGDFSRGQQRKETSFEPAFQSRLTHCTEKTHHRADAENNKAIVPIENPFPRLHNHTREQISYFGPEGLLRRHEYTVGSPMQRCVKYQS